jgi:uncharacterized protein YbaP (TraB family)
MRRKKALIPAFVAIFAGIVTVFIAVSEDKPSDCFTWKVKINGSAFYLTGSVHGASEGNYPLPETYLKSYKKAEKVIFELKDDFKTLEDKIFLYAEKDKLPDGLSLGDSLKPESIDKLRAIIDNDKLNKYFGYEGWLLNMIIAGNKYKLCGYDPKLAIDKYFHDLATKDKKEIIGLDEIQTQLALFDFDLPFKIQIKILEKAVSEMAVKAKSEEELFKAYFENNQEKFKKEFLRPYNFENPQMKNMYDMAFTKRNTRWVEQFIELSRGDPGSYFVIVGSGHYFGPNNILELLENKGYTIEKT